VLTKRESYELRLMESAGDSPGSGTRIG
jgi:hypothetical protein